MCEADDVADFFFGDGLRGIMLTAVRLLAAALANMATGLILLIRRLPIAKSATHGPLFSGLLRRLETPTAMPERWVAEAAAGEPAEQLAHGIDCGCYYTANLFARGQHYSFRDVAHFDSFAAALRRSVDAADAPGATVRASQEDEELPPNVSRLPAKERAALLDALETEVRRRGAWSSPPTPASAPSPENTSVCIQSCGNFPRTFCIPTLSGWCKGSAPARRPKMELQRWAGRRLCSASWRRVRTSFPSSHRASAGCCVKRSATSEVLGCREAR